MSKEGSGAVAVLDLADIAIASGQPIDMIDLIMRHYPLSKKHFVLEAGMGTGKLGMSMATRFGCHVTLVDNDPRAIERASRLKWCVEGIKAHDIPVTIVSDNIMSMRYDDDTFHLVFSEGVVEHSRDPSIPVREMVRVSRDAVAIIVPHALNEKQVEMAKRQTETYKDRPEFWASYEKPMLQEEVQKLLEGVGLTDVFTTLVWAEPVPPKTRADFRMVFGFGRKPHRV